MCYVDILCEKCNYKWEYDKGTIMRNVEPNLQCPACGSTKTRRLFAVGATDVAGGKLGTGKTGMQNNVTYHPSSLAPNSRGTKVKMK